MLLGSGTLHNVLQLVLCVCVSVCVRACVCSCICVCILVRERERQRAERSIVHKIRLSQSPAKDSLLRSGVSKATIITHTAVEDDDLMAADKNIAIHLLIFCRDTFDIKATICHTIKLF